MIFHTLWAVIPVMDPPVGIYGVKLAPDINWSDQCYPFIPGRHSGQPPLTSQVCYGRYNCPRLLFCRPPGICAIASPSCYVWTNALGQEERSVQKSKEKATWLSKVDPDGLWDLCIWRSPGPQAGELPRPVHPLCKAVVLLTAALIKCCTRQSEWIWLKPLLIRSVKMAHGGTYSWENLPKAKTV